jgi:chitinase
MMNHLSGLRLLVFVALLLTALPGIATQTLGAGERNDREEVFVGYLFRQPAKINYRLYTHLCHAFLVADEDGKIRTSRNVPSRSVTGEAHKAGVKVILSLGGWGWDKQFASIVSKPEAFDRYVKAVMEIVDTYDYDGIDLDWEYPDTSEEIVGFDRLVRRFRKELDELGRKKGKPMVQTMAVSSNSGTLRWLKKDVVLETMDWLNVMTYDYSGTWTPYAGHNSPLHASSRQPGGSPRSTELTMRYLVRDRGFPPGRLAVGIPLYGRGFAVSEPYASTKNVPAARARVGGGNYARMEKLLKEGWTRRWDDETKNPWLLAPDRSAVIGYDDAESVSIKTEWAMKEGFRGVFFWEVGGDLLPDGTNPLQDAAHKKWADNPRRKP